jgi:hypothetical protein
MKIKPTSVYNICEFIIYIENHLHVSATFLAIFREALYEEYVTKNHKQYINIKYIINSRILYAPVGFILILKYQKMVMKYLKSTHPLFFLPTTKLVTSLI